MITQTKEFGPMNIECSDISPCPASFILVFYLHGRSRLRRIGSVSPSPSLDTGLLIGTQNKLILFERFFVPNPMIQIENFSGFSSKIWISGENPTPMLPRLDGVLMQPAPHCITADRSNETRLPNMTHNIFNAPARKGYSIFSWQFTGDRFNLDDEIWCLVPAYSPN
jgi:hypothetical protein